MWRKTGQFILANRIPLLIVLIAATALMGYYASKVELSYEFTRAIPANHPANKTYQAFKQKYGQDGNLLVIGIQTKELFNEKFELRKRVAVEARPGTARYGWGSPRR